MVMHLVLTVVVLLCFFLAATVIDRAPFPEPAIKWCLYAIAVIIAICAILGIWGLLGANAFG